MPADSRKVSSNQQHTHAKLPQLVRRHLANTHQKPIAPHSLNAYRALKDALYDRQRPLVLDSFCGTGKSTALLAERYPDHLVVGVDKSAHRLSKHIKSQCHNYLLLQADCEDIWQLLLRDQVALDYHYLLYPNPWPKSRHLQRRIHGSAAFCWLLQLGGRVELRSNWQLYVEEFGLATQLAGHAGRVFLLQQQPSITLFEEKYQASGHDLWAYVATLNTQAISDDTGNLG